MNHLDHRLVRQLDAHRIPAHLDAHVALRDAAADASADPRPHPVRLAVGRSLVAVGRWVAAEPPPRRARSL
jgi:hypothetical protein